MGKISKYWKKVSFELMKNKFLSLNPHFSFHPCSFPIMLSKPYAWHWWDRQMQQKIPQSFLMHTKNLILMCPEGWCDWSTQTHCCNHLLMLYPHTLSMMLICHVPQLSYLHYQYWSIRGHCKVSQNLGGEGRLGMQGVKGKRGFKLKNMFSTSSKLNFGTNPKLHSACL